MQRKVSHPLSLVSAAVVMLMAAGAVHGKDLKAVKEWTGQVADAKLEKEWPNASPITNKDDFAKVWKAWAGDKEVPEVDFEKELVLVSTNKVGQISGLILSDQKGGSYVSTGSIDAKRTRGFYYAFTVFKREGVKVINGKPVK
jgi:hypothetical protein